MNNIANIDTLEEKFGGDEVSSLINTYNERQTAWTSTIAWHCAANSYGRTINVHSRSGNLFKTDGRGMIEPTSIFLPEGKPQGEPIHLVLWGPHYALLVPKK